ncbi:MAG TPA: DEAD/DEAH box helicase family protein [Candidatus Binatia bacterium]|nr:DEAD/DEAH box helicase family protein [Candidatus Binatia bacterium]
MAQLTPEEIDSIDIGGPSTAAPKGLSPQEIDSIEIPSAPVRARAIRAPKVADELGVGEELAGVGRALERGGRRFVQAGSISGLRKPQEIKDELDRETAALAKYDAEFGPKPNPATDPVGTRWRNDQLGKIGGLQNELKRWEKMRPELAKSVAKQQTAIEKLPMTQAQEEFHKEETPWWHFFKNPVELTATTLAESMPVMAQSMAAAPGGPVAVAAATGVGSFRAESSGRVMNAMAKAGVDLKNPEMVMAWFSDRAKADPELAKADLAALGPATFDTLTAGMAGRFLGPAIGKGVRPVLTATGKEMGLQMAGGGLGTIAGSKLVSEPIDWKDFVLEVAGEFAPGEAVANVMAERNLRNGGPGGPGGPGAPLTPEQIDSIPTGGPNADREQSPVAPSGARRTEGIPPVGEGAASPVQPPPGAPQAQAEAPAAPFVPVDELLKRAPGDTSPAELFALPEDQASQFFTGNQARQNATQYDAVLAGMKLTPEAVPELERLRADAMAKSMAALQAQDNTAFLANQGKVIWINGVIEGANKKGPNYDAVSQRQKQSPPAPDAGDGQTRPESGGTPGAVVEPKGGDQRGLQRKEEGQAQDGGILIPEPKTGTVPADGSVPDGTESDTVLDPNRFPVANVPMGRVIYSHGAVPNFKAGADVETGVVPGKELSGKFQRLGVAPIVLWEPANPEQYGLKPGEYAIVTGRHRVDLARRTGEADIPAQVVREADGWTRERVMSFDAFSNIRDEQGTTEDYADFFRHAQNITEAEAREAGLFGRAKGRTGWDIGRNASEDLFAIYKAGKISDAQAAAIARTAPGNAILQDVGIRAALDGESPATAAEAMESAKAKALETGNLDQADFFANTSLAEGWKAEAKKVIAVRKGIEDEIKAIKNAANNPTAAAKHGVDVKDPEGVRKKIAELQAELTRWDKWREHPDLVAQIRGEPKAKTPVAPAPEAKAPESKPAPGLKKRAPAMRKEKPQPPKPAKPEKPPTKPATPSKPTGLTPEEQARLDDIHAKLRKKFGGGSPGDPQQLGAGAPIDPEIITLGAELVSIHVKQGVRKFADFSGRVKAELPEIWDAIKVHLRSMWEAAAVNNPDIEEVTRAQADETIRALDGTKPVKSGTVEAKPETEGSKPETKAPEPVTKPVEPVTSPASAKPVAPKDAEPIKIESSPKAEVVIGFDQSSDFRMAISQANNHYTLWVSRKPKEGSPVRWRYVAILGGNKAEAHERAIAAANRIASGDLTGIAFQGKDLFEGIKKISVLPDELGRDQLMGTDRVSIGEQPLNFGKKHPNLKIKDLWATDPDYARWIIAEASGKRAGQIRDYITNQPDYITSQNNAVIAAAEAVTNEAREILKGYGMTAEPQADGSILVGGETYDWKGTIKEFGGRFDGETTSWRLTPKGFADFIAKLGTLPRPAGRRGVGIPLYLRDPRLGDLRKASDARPDRSGFTEPIGQFVGSDTQALLKEGLKVGMPPMVVDEQIEDVARINRGYQRGDRLFLLASEPGSGKTFVLGGAIREARKSGAKKIGYVTLRQELITQIKQDLKAYDIGDVRFITYPEMRKLPAEELDMLIFDEAHSIKNVNGEGDNVSQQAQAARNWIEKAKMTVLASATPYENPTQAAYLEPTGIFAPFVDFWNFALSHGATERTVRIRTPRGEIEKKELVWKRTTTSDIDSKAAREFFRKEGVFTSRKIRLNPNSFDSRLVKVQANSGIADMYAAFTEAATEKEESIGTFAKMWVKNFQKRILESGKVERGIQEAEAAMKRGRWPIIFVETKAERKIDIPDLIRREDEWARAVASTKKGDTPPARSEFNLPPQGITDIMASFMAKTGIEEIVIPSAEDLIEKHFGAENVAIFTGSVTPKKAQENLDRWRQPTRPIVLVATLAKGGTGLSLHDKVGNHQTTQININLPWTATGVVQVAQRSARYGLKGKAEMQWIFAENIPFDQELAGRVGGRMADMGSIVQGDKLQGAEEIETWDFNGMPFSEVNGEIGKTPPVEPAQPSPAAAPAQELSDYQKVAATYGWTIESGELKNRNGKTIAIINPKLGRLQFLSPDDKRVMGTIPVDNLKMFDEILRDKFYGEKLPAAPAGSPAAPSQFAKGDLVRVAGPKPVVGSVWFFRPDGAIEVRLQQGGVRVVQPSELTKIDGQPPAAAPVEAAPADDLATKTYARDPQQAAAVEYIRADLTSAKSKGFEQAWAEYPTKSTDPKQLAKEAAWFKFAYNWWEDHWKPETDGESIVQPDMTGLDQPSQDQQLDKALEEGGRAADDALDQFWQEAGEMPPRIQGTVSAEEKAKQAGRVLTQEEAQNVQKQWMDQLKKIAGERSSENGQKIVLSLFDRTGVWAEPFLAAGYDVRIIDLATDGVDVKDIDMEWLADYDMTDVHFVLSANPCDDFAVSGARWWAEKDADGRTEYSVGLANHTLAIIEYLKPVGWALENPVGRLSKLVPGVGEPRLQFHPFNYGDAYTKRTQIFGNFNPNLPQANVFPDEGSRMHKLRGDDPEQKAQRSETPEGFAIAFALANANLGPAARVSEIVQENKALAAPVPAAAGRNWEAYAEGLRDDLESFSPARHTGKIDYDLMDVADRFVEYAKSRPEADIVKLVTEFSKTDAASAAQIKKLRQSVKSLEAQQSQPPPAAAPDDESEITLESETPETLRRARNEDEQTIRNLQSQGYPLDAIFDSDAGKRLGRARVEALLQPPVGLNPVQQERFQELSIKARNARERGGVPLSGAELKEYQDLEKLAGAQDLPLGAVAPKPLVLEGEQVVEKPPDKPKPDDQGNLFSMPNLDIDVDSQAGDKAYHDLLTNWQTADTVLDAMLPNVRNDFERELIGRLRGLGLQTRIKLMPQSEAVRRGLPEGNAVYNIDGDFIYLFPASPNNTKSLLHEFVHAATVKAIVTDKGLAAELESILAATREQLPRWFYGKTNTLEMVAEAFTSPEFQQAMEKVKVGNQTLWDQFVDWVRKVIGLPSNQKNALDEVIRLTSAKFSSPGAPVTMDGQPMILRPPHQAVHFPGDLASMASDQEPSGDQIGDNIADVEASGELEKALDEAQKDGLFDKTQRIGVIDRIMGRQHLTPEVREAGANYARQIFRQAGLNIVPDQDGWFELADPSTPAEAEGQKLLELVRGELEKYADDKSGYLGHLINSIRNNMTGSGVKAFSKPLRMDLYAATQGEASHRGLLLGALAGLQKTIAYVGRNVEAMLHKEYHGRFGGDFLEKIMPRIIREFRGFFTDDEIKQAVAGNPKLQEFFDKVFAINRADVGGRLYRRVQSYLKPKPVKLKKMIESAKLTEAFNEIINQAKRLGIEPPPVDAKKALTPREQLALMAKPETAGQLNDAIAIAVEDAEKAAARKVALKEAKTDEEKAEIMDEGWEPTEEQVEAGLDLEEYAHWREIRDNLLGYSPITVNLAKKLVQSEFKGTDYSKNTPKLANALKIDLDKLAVSPEEEVRRVLEEYYKGVEATVLRAGASPESKARILSLVRDEVADQLTKAKQKRLQPIFRDPKAPGSGPTPMQQVEQLGNAGLFLDPRLDSREQVEKVAGRSPFTRLVPNLPELIKAALDTPFYRQGDLGRAFADKLVKELGLTPEQAKGASTVFNEAFGQRFKVARERALANVEKSLTPQPRNEPAAKKATWQKITEAVNAGYFDSGEALRRIAAANGWTVPTDEQIEKMRGWVEKMERMKELTPVERDAVGDNALDLERALRDKASATLEKRVAIKKQIEAMWARLTHPLTFKNQVGRSNIARAVNEFASANLLFKLSFPFRQVIDILTQGGIHTPTRAIAAAIERYNLAPVVDANTGQVGNKEKLWKEVGLALKDAYKARSQSYRAALQAARDAFAGTGEARNVDRLMSSIAVFDRAAQIADEHEAAGRTGQAAALRIFTLLRMGFRVAQAMDNIHGLPAEYQEMRQQVVTALRENGQSSAEAFTNADNVIGDMKAEYQLAIGRAQSILDGLHAAGLTEKPPTANEVKGAAWMLVKGRAYQRMQEAGLPADAFEESNRFLRSTVGWNEREDGGIGGIVGKVMSAATQATQKAGIPMPLLRFGNAIATSINRSLSFTPLGFFPDAFEGSPWFKSKQDQRQRKVEAAIGTSVGLALFALAVSGVLRVRNRWPKDKEERELWEREGHRPGTVEIDLGGGDFMPISMTTGPLTLLRPWLATAGAIRDLIDEREKAQAKLNAEAERLGLPAKQLPGPNASDLLGVGASTLWGSIVGGRTAAGLIGSVTDYGTPNIKKSTAAVISPVLPTLPMAQELSRMAGARADAKLAGVTDFLIPVPGGRAQQLNLLGDPVGTDNDVQRILQILTGGTGLPLSPQEVKDQAAYSTLYSSGYRPPSINPGRGYDFGGEYRPMTQDELVNYTKARGQFLKEELAAIGQEASPSVVRKAYTRANDQALQSVGAAVRTRTVRTPLATVRTTTVSSGIPRPRIPAGRALRRPSVRARIRSRSLRARATRRARFRSSLMPRQRAARRALLR